MLQSKKLLVDLQGFVLVYNTLGFVLDLCSIHILFFLGIIPNLITSFTTIFISKKLLNYFI